MSDARWTAAQVAEHLGVAVTTVYAYRRDGILPPATMVGRTPTWTPEQIIEWSKTRPGQGVGGGRPSRREQG